MLSTQLKHLQTQVYKSKYINYLFYILPLTALVAAIIYSGKITNFFFSNIQDDLLYRYLFQNFSFNDMIVPLNHANILKYPLYFLQSIFPYDYTNLTIVNFGLVISTIAGIVIVFTYIFGRKFFPLICALLAVLMFSSVSLNINLMETTIRNIEYPIGLGFLLALGLLWRRPRINKKLLVFTSLITCLMALAISGDTLLLYAFCIPPVGVVLMSSLIKRKVTKPDLNVLINTGVVVILAVVIRKFIAWTGFTIYFLSPQFETKIAPFDSILPAFNQAILQLIRLSGADIFGLKVAPSTSIFFLNFLLLITGVVGLGLMFKQGLRNLKLSPIQARFDLFLKLVMPFTFLLVFFAYIFAGQVVNKTPEGIFVDAHQERYITLLPFLSIFGFLYVTKTAYKDRRLATLVIMIILGLSTFASFSSIVGSYSPIKLGAEAKRENISDIVNVAQKNNVDLLIAGDGYGAALTFWSGNRIPYVSVINCDRWFPYNTRLSWQDPSKDKPAVSALVVDRSGSDAPYWVDCSQEKIKSIYGTPQRIEQVKNRLGSEPVELWIYNKDIRRYIKSS